MKNKGVNSPLIDISNKKQNTFKEDNDIIHFTNESDLLILDEFHFENQVNEKDEFLLIP